MSLTNEPYVEVLDLHSIPIKLDCAICMEAFDPEQGAVGKNLFTCSTPKEGPHHEHYFHERCIEKWAKEKMGCPLCAEPLRTSNFRLSTQLLERYRKELQQRLASSSHFDLIRRMNMLDRFCICFSTLLGVVLLAAMVLKIVIILQ